MRAKGLPHRRPGCLWAVFKNFQKIENFWNPTGHVKQNLSPLRIFCDFGCVKGVKLATKFPKPDVSSSALPLVVQRLFLSQFWAQKCVHRSILGFKIGRILDRVIFGQNGPLGPLLRGSGTGSDFWPGLGQNPMCRVRFWAQIGEFWA